MRTVQSGSVAPPLKSLPSLSPVAAKARTQIRKIDAHRPLVPSNARDLLLPGSASQNGSRIHTALRRAPRAPDARLKAIQEVRAHAGIVDEAGSCRSRKLA